MIDCAVCRHPVAAVTTLCMYCGGDPAGKAAVLTMDGKVLFTLKQDECIVLGRECATAAIADPLNEFDDVSRVHAELTLRGDGSVEILDRSRYGTFVDDDQLSPGDEANRRFDLPIELRLAKRCVLRIEAPR